MVTIAGRQAGGEGGLQKGEGITPPTVFKIGLFSLCRPIVHISEIFILL